MDPNRPSREARRRRAAKAAEKAAAELAAAQENRHHRSQRPSNRDRRVHQDMTIRTVSPEGMSQGTVSPLSSPIEAYPPAAPPSSSARINRNRDMPAEILRDFPVRSDSHDKEFGVKYVGELPSRPRTRTLEERRRDRSPTAIVTKSRHRIGSVHSTSSASYRGAEEPVTSIGHPSTISPSSPEEPITRASTSSRSRPVRHSPHGEHPRPRTTPDQDYMPAPVPSSNSKKILHLMRSIQGRMQGTLAFRRGDSNPWSLSHCYIDEEAGSLLYEVKSDTPIRKTLIPDLRGCRVKIAADAESFLPYLDVLLHNSTLEIHLRPHTHEELDSWLAALLCWHPIKPKGIRNKMAKPQASVISDRRLADSRRHSELSLLKEAPIIKVGKMIYWDTSVSFPEATSPGRTRPRVHKMHSFESRRWRKVSCTLRENGELKLYSDSDVTLVSVIQLSQLSRCAIQRLDPSVLDNEFSIAIYPHYNCGSTNLSSLRPIFLSLESRVLFEVWVVLLRAFTIPELYGPKAPSLEEDINSGQMSQGLFASTQTADMFRMERSLHIRVIEARLLPPVSARTFEQGNREPGSGNASPQTFGYYYVEILLDSETRAKTMVKEEGINPFWREDFSFQDIPAVLSTASVVLKKRPPSSPQNERVTRPREDSVNSQDPRSVTSSAGYSDIFFDMTLGKVDIYLDDIDPAEDLERWWPLVNAYGQNIGEALLKIRLDESVILMARDYQPMSELLHNFSNGLTLQTAKMIGGELSRLSECLLNIFQVSGKASEWIMAMVEEEIDGTQKETPVSRLRFNKRVASNGSIADESIASASERELMVRDLGKSATLEANLLFRGNTLLTKALEVHMNRLGREYLEDALGDKLKEIVERDPECEIDPNRVTTKSEMEKNWRRLVGLNEEMWKSIYSSASRCPPELRMIFRHIRACAEDRYGGFLRTVSYSSVSGFLFLRFFCPAVLNPQLFGLLKDHPKPRARRALTLIAKTLQGLANVTTFGAKEYWMEPMNHFLASHRQEFKSFIDTICSMPQDRNLTALPPSYSTPLAILQRLPPTSREGFPSLPYLIDHAQNFAILVNLWLENTKETASNIQVTDGDLLKFHHQCLSLHQRTQECLDRAEWAERPGSGHSLAWEELVEQLESASMFDGGSSSSSAGWAAYSPPSNTATANTTATVVTTSSTFGAAAKSPTGNRSRTAIAQSPVSITTSMTATSHYSETGEDTPSELDDAAPSRAYTGSSVSSETDVTTALPPVNGRLRHRDRDRALDRERDRERSKLTDLVSGFRKKRDKGDT